MSDGLSVNMCIKVVKPPFVRRGFMQVRFVPHLRVLVACLGRRR
jgi:hypothetical protein